MTAEQLEASRSERMRQNGNGTLTFEDARTWIEETGLCLFLPRRQYSASVAPSFVEAVAGQQSANPDRKHIALAEELLVRLEAESVAVRLNLLGQAGEQPDFVVAAWVLPYVYALRGDRDWRRSPQLTGSRQVSPLAVQTYKLLEAGDSAISQLTHNLGREVTESAVLRAITELWQQLRIIPTFSALGEPARWQLLRQRFQKAIAEGASTSQVTAISVLASIYLQAVIAATMEEVELFLAPLTARSKVREVLRGLVATRQVHTLALGHAPHFYVAGTLPEFAEPSTLYASSSITASSYFLNSYEPEDDAPALAPAPAVKPEEPVAAAIEASAAPQQKSSEPHIVRTPAAHKPASNGKPAATRPHFSRPATLSRDRKPAQTSSTTRTARRPASDSRPAPSRTHNGAHAANSSSTGARATGNGNSRISARGQRSRSANGAKPSSSAVGATRTSSSNRSEARSDARGSARSDSRAGRPVSRNSSRKPALAAGTKAGNSKRFGFTARPGQGTKKRG